MGLIATAPHSCAELFLGLKDGGTDPSTGWVLMRRFYQIDQLVPSEKKALLKTIDSYLKANLPPDRP
jgi:hypothetical protein